ncbi:bifunctional endo-1,4-beta-xylanase XylA-like [Saccostrea echinata]|uniref:bifunctional endo-1,4-beta-xylanase XylA-like n=1 Tax=Saccostrea echinata TaxID=191078 RepID=UPI002A834F05|nr:bifunctional endo-1,4-beta-xylanase XylA-like [Saccostrea echinata]
MNRKNTPLVPIFNCKKRTREAIIAEEGENYTSPSDFVHSDHCRPSTGDSHIDAPQNIGYDHNNQMAPYSYQKNKTWENEQNFQCQSSQSEGMKNNSRFQYQHSSTQMNRGRERNFNQNSYSQTRNSQRSNMDLIPPNPPNPKTAKYTASQRSAGAGNSQHNRPPGGGQGPDNRVGYRGQGTDNRGGYRQNASNSKGHGRGISDTQNNMHPNATSSSSYQKQSQNQWEKSKQWNSGSNQGSSSSNQWNNRSNQWNSGSNQLNSQRNSGSKQRSSGSNQWNSGSKQLNDGNSQWNRCSGNFDFRNRAGSAETGFLSGNQSWSQSKIVGQRQSGNQWGRDGQMQPAVDMSGSACNVDRRYAPIASSFQIPDATGDGVPLHSVSGDSWHKNVWTTQQQGIERTQSTKAPNTAETKPDQKPALDRSLRVITTDLAGIQNWEHLRGMFTFLFEIFAQVNSATVKVPEVDAKRFSVKEYNTSMDCIFYEIDHSLPKLTGGKIYRIVGSYDSHQNLIKCVSIREANQEEHVAHQKNVEVCAEYKLKLSSLVREQ